MSNKKVEKAFKRFNAGERPWRLVEKDWYVADSSGSLYPLKYIWALVTGDKPRSFNTREAREEIASRDYSIININAIQSKQESKKNKKYPKKPVKKLALTIIYDRNPKVVKDVLKRADGKCEKCNNDAPFKRYKDNTPYLEVHHIKQLSHGGDDTVANAIALCPNCHREEHFGTNIV